VKYLRNREAQEVDFLLTVDSKPWIAIETKLNNQTISKNLYYYQKKLKIPYTFQVIKKTGIDFLQNNVRVISADKFLSALV
jgi:predicted AAA+ superfamily ATPase